MPSLKKDATTGALLKNSGGALVDVCAASCSDCDPGGSGSTPEDAEITDGLGTCSSLDGISRSFDTFSENSERCTWNFRSSGADTTQIELVFAKTAYNFSGSQGCSTISLAAGEWAIAINFLLGGSAKAYLREKTTGFSCNPTTGKVSGTHLYTVSACGNEASACPDPEDEVRVTIDT